LFKQYNISIIGTDNSASLGQFYLF